MCKLDFAKKRWLARGRGYAQRLAVRLWPRQRGFYLYGERRHFEDQLAAVRARTRVGPNY